MVPYTSHELRPLLSRLSFQGPIDPFLVLADWLQERDDPWGDLIAVDAALEAHASDPASSKSALVEEREALVARHGEALCRLHRWASARLVYRRGFVAGASLGDCGAIDANELCARLTGLLSSPAATLIESIGLSASGLADHHAKALISAMDRLHHTHVDLRGNMFSAATVDDLKKALPHADLSNQKEPSRPNQAQEAYFAHEAYFAESGSEHRAFIRLHGGPRSIEDIDD